MRHSVILSILSFLHSLHGSDNKLHFFKVNLSVPIPGWDCSYDKEPDR